ncbi:DUF4129 domain-containing protein [Leeuwenhoekiella sp. ZYFB001]|uniref:DUF4129 domain-containing protein n=1 Tax=Leeuwenhoekiella sp. ZYFB001 TaxID=2719912 RepID=UPI00142FB135|nr:DUF4129 domain-containing protein [Leeuwenhoekiella sp. ZYFB001]
MITKLFYILICLFSFAAFAQNTNDSTTVARQVRYDDSVVAPKYFEEQALEEYRQDDAFDYVAFVPPDNIWTRFKTWLNDLWASFIQWLLQGEEVGGILGFLIEALPYLIIILVVALLVWFIMRIDFGGSPLKTNALNKVILSDEQKIIETQNIQELIDTALKENNYRLAVRFYYLLLLQKLAQKDIIDWQAQKTNADYVYEIKNDTLRADFTKLTRIYDFIWYGNFNVSSHQFLKAEKEFKKTTADL